MNMTFGPMHYVGLVGMPRRNFTFPSGMGWDLWNLVASLSVLFMIAGVGLFVYNALRSARSGEVAGDDPWDARTLEWAMSSPPPHYNFAEIPVVHGRDALWEQKYPDEEHAAPPPVPAGGAHEADEEHHDIHMPSPSYFPLICALGIFALGLTLLLYQMAAPLGYAAGAIGIVLLLWGSYGWIFEPTD